MRNTWRVLLCITVGFVLGVIALGLLGFQYLTGKESELAQASAQITILAEKVQAYESCQGSEKDWRTWVEEWSPEDSGVIYLTIMDSKNSVWQVFALRCAPPGLLSTYDETGELELTGAKVCSSIRFGEDGGVKSVRYVGLNPAGNAAVLDGKRILEKRQAASATPPPAPAP